MSLNTWISVRGRTSCLCNVEITNYLHLAEHSEIGSVPTQPEHLPFLAFIVGTGDKVTLQHWHESTLLEMLS